MTLCIAWKDNNTIRFASDSRLTYPGNLYADIGIKIFSIPTKIYSPVDSETNEMSVLYDHELGMCFAGDNTNAYVVKETVYEILRSLQCLPYIEISMDKICNQISKFYDHVTRVIFDNIRNYWKASFFLGGYCPNQNKVRVFKFNQINKNYQIQVEFKEILIRERIEYLGAGATNARIILRNNPSMKIFQVLKEVIDDNSMASVGGHIQYGDFENLNFKIKGIIEHKIYANGRREAKFCLRGTELYKSDVETCDFHISYPFKDPFTQS